MPGTRPDQLGAASCETPYQLNAPCGLQQDFGLHSKATVYGISGPRSLTSATYGRGTSEGEFSFRQDGMIKLLLDDRGAATPLIRDRERRSGEIICRPVLWAANV